jgi:hypothetical protein
MRVTVSPIIFQVLFENFVYFVGKYLHTRVVTLYLMICLALSLSGCQTAKKDNFAIYLLAQDIPVRKLSQTDTGQLVLKTEPILSGDDIISYGRTSHSIELTRAAYSRIRGIFPIPAELDGIAFVVCVGKERIYPGAFWTPRSAITYDGVVIMQPFDADLPMIQIALGYPVPGVFTGTDPRADPRIMKILEQDKKLK